jgi:single-stranded-DNA-specific exonuclease
LTALGSPIPEPDGFKPAFLRVENSARGLRWVERLTPGYENTAISMAQEYGITDILARILAARGIAPDKVLEYLNPTLKSLMPDPSTLQDMDVATERFTKAIRNKEPIAIFGDYDVDGASSVALIRKFLFAHNHEAQFYIPDRTLEGYGPSITAFEQLVADGAKLIITVDCGTMAFVPITRAKELGADVIVLDHHQAEEQLPDAMAVINPNRLDDVSGQGHLAAAGVVYLFLVAATRTLRNDAWYDGDTPTPDLMQLLDMVALATVCDVVPLTGLNRAFVCRGLEVLHQRQNLGLRVLSDTAGLTSAPTSYHLGYVLGPRLNAGGRIGRSDLATCLLSGEDEPRAIEIASILEQLNTERRLMQDALQEEALSQADQTFQSHPEAVLAIAQGEDWHKGLIGLVAARLTERFSKPSLSISWDKNGTGSGSARSIQGADIGAAIRSAVEAGLLEKGGGHAMAAGFTVASDNADAFFSHVEKMLHPQVLQANAEANLKIDGALMASSTTLGLMSQLEKAGPYGAGNPQPRFAFAAHRCKFAKIVGDRHVRCSLTSSDGSRIDAIAFNSAETSVGKILLESKGLPLHVVGRLRRSNWGGREKMELHIEDIADPHS